MTSLMCRRTSSRTDCRSGDYMDLWNELEDKRKQLIDAVKALARYGKEYAKAERDYKVLLRKEALKLRDEGYAVGMITLTVYGLEEVADARQARDIAEAMYKTAQELINSVKLEMRIIESQLDREWSVRE